MFLHVYVFICFHVFFVSDFSIVIKKFGCDYIILILNIMFWVSWVAHVYYSVVTHVQIRGKGFGAIKLLLYVSYFCLNCLLSKYFVLYWIRLFIYLLLTASNASCGFLSSLILFYFISRSSVISSVSMYP